MTYTGREPALKGLSPTVHETLVQILIQIKDLLEKVGEVADSYGLGSLTPEIPRIQRSPSLAIEEINRQATLVFKVEKSCNVFKRLRWVVRDCTKFGILLSHLTNLIDTLYEFCPVGRQRELTHAVEAETLATTIIDNGIYGVRQLQNAARESNSASLQGASVIAVAMEGARTANEAAQLVGTHVPFRPADDIILNLRRIRFTDHSNHSTIRAWALLQDQLQGGSYGYQSRASPVVVEWRHYDAMALRHMSKIEMQARLEGLVRMLQSSGRNSRFKNLDCVGYFEDNTAPRFGLVYRYPSNWESTSSPETLGEILGRGRSVPYLEERFALADFLAESLYEFLAAGWLHKSINSNNLLFFQGADPASEGRISLNEPYFSGFARSRPDDPNAVTELAMNDLAETLYCHPDIMGGETRAAARFHALHDIYSLGTVLLEIGTWTSLRRRYIPGTDGPSFRRQLLKTDVPQLGPAVGGRFMTVVKKCIGGSFDGLAGFTGTEPDYNLNLLRSFYWEVVSVLKSCQV